MMQTIELFLQMFVLRPDCYNGTVHRTLSNFKGHLYVVLCTDASVLGTHGYSVLRKSMQELKI